MKFIRILSFILVVSIIFLLPVFAEENDYVTSVYPNVDDAIIYDFTSFGSSAKLPVQLQQYTNSAGSVGFDNSICISSQAEGGEAYIYHNAFESVNSLVIDTELSASRSGNGVIRVYLRDSLPAHNGCEISLIRFERNMLTVFDRDTSSYSPGEYNRFRIQFDFVSGKSAVYMNDSLIASYDNIYEVLPELRDFGYNSFYPRFHVYSSDNATNTLNIRTLNIGSEKSNVNDLSAMCMGVYSGGHRLNILKSGDIYSLWSLSNTTDSDKEYTIVSGIDNYNYTSVTIPAGKAVLVQAPCYTDVMYGAKTYRSYITDSAGTLVSDIYTLSYMGYNPPSSDTILADSAFSDGIHPRLVANSDDFDKALSLVSDNSMISDAYSRGYDKTLADKLIQRHPGGQYVHVPCPYNDDDGLRLVSADTILRYCKALAGEYKLTGDVRYKERLWAELYNAGNNFPDWNPQHFLDTASIAAAFAISYDWLYDDWDSSQKNFIKFHLSEKALNEYDDVYAGRNDLYGEWRYRRNNWNIVCNGGAILAALSLIDDPSYSDLSAKVAEGAMMSLSTALKSFYPDGAWYEGVGYWSYSMQFLTLIMSSLENTLGTLYGIDAVEGLQKSALFGMYLTGEYTLNLNDTGAGEYISMPECLYFASRFNNDDAAAYRLGQLEKYDNEAEILDLLWYDDRFTNADSSDISGMGVLRGIDIAAFKGKDTYAAIHWGYNNISHGHLDSGTIFYDNDGVRWLEDLGSDDYNLNAYFNVSDEAYPDNRWGYFRCRAEGHNTMVIGDDTSRPDQIPDSSGNILKSVDWGRGAYAAIDLSDCYANASSVKRGVMFDAISGRMTLCDEVSLKPEHRGEEIYHIFHTNAMVVISDDGKTASLYKVVSKRLKSIKLRILSEGDLSFALRDDKPMNGNPNPSGQALNSTKMLYVKQADESDVNTLQIVFLPEGDGNNMANLPKLMPDIDKW